MTRQHTQPPCNPTDPVADWGREREALYQALNTAECDRQQASHDFIEVYRLDDRIKLISNRLNAVEEMIALTPASSAEGALTQLLLATGEADPALEPFDYLDLQTRIHRMLYSAIGAIEAHTGLRREDFAGDRCAPREFSPFIDGAVA